MYCAVWHLNICEIYVSQFINCINGVSVEVRIINSVSFSVQVFWHPITAGDARRPYVWYAPGM